MHYYQKRVTYFLCKPLLWQLFIIINALKLLINATYLELNNPLYFLGQPKCVSPSENGAIQRWRSGKKRLPTAFKSS
jgi:hypothetical protein